MPIHLVPPLGGLLSTRGGHGKGLQPCFTIREDLTDRVGQIFGRKFVRSSSFALVALVVLGEVLRKMSASSPQQRPSSLTIVVPARLA